MSVFTVDTSGAVGPMLEMAAGRGLDYLTWSDLTPFCQGYVEALFGALPWSNVYCDDCPPDGYPTDETRCSECPRRRRFDMISPSALERIVRDCGEMVRVRIDADMPTDAAAGANYWCWRQEGILTSWPALTVSLDDAGKVTLADRVQA